MKSFLKFLIIFSGILLLSAFLAPLLFKFLPFKFERIFNRLVMIFSIAAAFFFVHIGPKTFRQYGLGWQPDSLKLFLKGFAAGVLTLIFLAAVKTSAGAARWNLIPFQARLYAEVLAKGLLTGIAVAVIEEFFFRGFVYGWLKDRWQWASVLSVGVTSFFYSLLHFVSRDNPFIGPDPQFKDSLRLIAVPFTSLLEWRDFWPEAVGLFLFGIVLNFLVIRTHSLYPSIGLHAGCVFFVKSDALFVEFLEKNRLIWGGTAAVDGVVSWVFLFLLWLAAALFVKKQGVDRKI